MHSLKIASYMIACSNILSVWWKNVCVPMCIFILNITYIYYIPEVIQ